MQHGLLTTPSDLGLATNRDGHDWLVFRLDELGLKPAPGEKVDLLVNIFLLIYESPGSATMRPGEGWTYVPPFGNVRLVKDPSGMDRLLGRTLEPASATWTYDLRDRHSVVVATGGYGESWSGISFFPVKFRLSPVLLYNTAFGTLAPSRLPLTFTPKRQLTPVASTPTLANSIVRDLKISQVWLADFETKLP
jgi:hypothetical protein